VNWHTIARNKRRDWRRKSPPRIEAKPTAKPDSAAALLISSLSAYGAGGWDVTSEEIYQLMREKPQPGKVAL
jgi:hypothetical protein